MEQVLSIHLPVPSYCRMSGLSYQLLGVNQLIPRGKGRHQANITTKSNYPNRQQHVPVCSQPSQTHPLPPQQSEKVGRRGEESGEIHERTGTGTGRTIPLSSKRGRKLLPLRTIGRLLCVEEEGTGWHFY